MPIDDIVGNKDVAIATFANVNVVGDGVDVEAGVGVDVGAIDAPDIGVGDGWDERNGVGSIDE